MLISLVNPSIFSGHITSTSIELAQFSWSAAIAISPAATFDIVTSPVEEFKFK